MRPSTVVAGFTLLVATGAIGCDARSRYELGQSVGSNSTTVAIVLVAVALAIVGLVAWRLAVSARRRRAAMADVLDER